MLSSKLFNSTSSPQGCIISSLLILRLKFADDSVIVSLLNDDDAEHGAVVDDFINWCSSFFLSINVSKTKDMTDFQKSKPTSTSSTVILNKEVKIVSEYKYLRTITDDTLSFEANTDAVCKKVQQSLFFLRKLKSLNVSNILMTFFYHSVIESVLIFCCVSWIGFLTLSNTKRLEKLVKIASKVIGVRQAQLQDIY